MVEIPERDSATVQAIYAAYERQRAKTEPPHRKHLGASVIGHPCSRYLWLTFRWAKAQYFPGRLLRLFQTGHLEEPRMCADLRAIGVTVSEGPAPGQQWYASACDGHFGSTIDGAAVGIPEAPKRWHVLEFKTHNAKSFGKTKSDGVQKAKPQHYAQMLVGMALHGMSRALYMFKNKDTDEVATERVREDPICAAQLLSRANNIIDAEAPPPRISERADWHECRFCHFHGVCHGQEPVEKNCRTCKFSFPITDGKWACDRFHENITDDMMVVGCEDYETIQGINR